MTIEKVIQLLESKQWKFAKTAAAKNPHWYTLKGNWGNDSEFLEMVKYIRKNGITEWFWSLKYTCLHYNGWKYWTMHTIDEEVILINKTFVSEQYDAIANIYDKLFIDEQSLEENKEVISMFIDKVAPNDKVLDVGCGTGMLCDYLNVPNYLGIDPSKSMVSIAKKKYPEKKFLVYKFETYHQKSDFIVSLFGSMNYVIDIYLKKLYEKLDFGGRYFLMFYKEDYDPITYDKSGKRLYHYKYTKEQLEKIFIDGIVNEYKNYYIVTNI